MTTPCHEVGGDLFDYVNRRDGSLAFAVADVAGKGTSAALLSAVVTGLFAAEAGAGDLPGDVISRMNLALCRRAVASRFVTIFYGDLTPDGRLLYCNAGHNAPFLVTSSGVSRLDVGGMVTGLFDAARFETGEARLGPDDVLVVFSDGLTEAVNPQEEEFGDERVAACLSGLQNRSAADVLGTLRAAAERFSETTAARDDVTILVLKGRQSSPS